MIKKFFHSLNTHKVRYLLISGQATVIYGASTFSEDIDLWVAPDKENWEKFKTVLSKNRARIYKLTPELLPEFILKGHGFHFTFPGMLRQAEWYLDVMGVVPRVGSFDKSWAHKKIFRTAWGVLPVIGIRELVELKKTRRLSDYPVISELVRVEHKNLSNKIISKRDWQWILSNSFEAEDIISYLKDKKALKIAKQLKRPCLAFCIKAVQNPSSYSKNIITADKEILAEIESIRHKDRLYWQPVLDELKYLNSKRLLLRKGTPVPRK